MVPLSAGLPDGNVIISSAIATKVVVGAAIGAGIDVATQISSQMTLDGKSFGQAFRNIDWTSVGASAIAGGAGLPGGNSLVKTATIASAIGYDASTDYSITKQSESILNGEKSSTSASVDAGMALVSGLPKTKINNEAIEASVDFLEGNIKSLLSKETKEMLENTEKLLDNDGSTDTKQNNNVISPKPMNNTETDRPYWQINF